MAHAIVFDELTAARFAQVCRMAAAATDEYAHLATMKDGNAVRALAPEVIFDYRQTNADDVTTHYRGWIVAGRRGGRRYCYSHESEN